MIGSLEGKAPAPEESKPSTAVAKVETPKAAPAVVAPAKATAVSKPEDANVEALGPFGELIPFGDPSWYQGVCTFFFFFLILVFQSRTNYLR